MKKCLFSALALLLSLGAFAAPTDSAVPVGEQAKKQSAEADPKDVLAELAARLPSREELPAYHGRFARVLLRTGRPAESIEHFRLAYLYAPATDEKEDLLLGRAEAYSQMRFFSEAALTYEVFLRTFPRSVRAEEARLGAAEAQFRQRRFREALRYFEQAGSSARALAGQGNSLQALGRAREAQEIYRRLLDRHAHFVNASPETRYSVGMNFLETGNPATAVVYLGALQDTPFQDQAALGLGRIYLDSAKPDLALTHLDLAASAEDRAVKREALLLRARALAGVKRDDEARELLQNLRRDYPYSGQYDEATLQLARMETAKGDSAAAVGYVRELIFRRTPSPEALELLEGLLTDLAEHQGAELERIWQNVGKWLLQPSRSAMLVKLAPALRPAGRPFLELCSWLVKYGDDEAKNASRLLLADYYASLGEPARAVAYLAAVPRKQRGPGAQRIEAKIAAQSGDLRAAAALMLALPDPREQDAVELLAIMRTGAAPEQAAAFCERALARADAAPRVRVLFADYLADQGRTVDALRHYRLAAASAAAPAGDREWAYSRIARLASGREREDALAALERGTGAAARLAALDGKGRELRARLRGER